MRNKLQLNGHWNFQLDPNDIGESKQWFNHGLKESTQVTVPHIWQKENLDYTGVAWYATEIHIDESFQEDELYLCFDAVDYQARVWVNGTYIGEHEGGFTPFEFNIKEFIQNGSNTLVVRVLDPSDNSEIPI